MDSPQRHKADRGSRARARHLGLTIGSFSPGPLNTITDVTGVRVGHLTRIEGDAVRTGATAIHPHPGNPYDERVPAGLAVANGYGKLMGATQLVELGEIETPILLTNTLAVPRAADAILDWTLAQLGNGSARSINPIVGETNDGTLNVIERRSLSVEEMRSALAAASGGPVEGGCVGAGTGTTAMGWKAGIGTSSRVLTSKAGTWTLGVLVQSNFPGSACIAGVPIGRLLADPDPPSSPGDEFTEGSIMIVVATDAPLSDRNLTRLARRTFAGLARTGASFSNGSGDYALAFSTAESVRRTRNRGAEIPTTDELANDQVSPLFEAAIEATEEAIVDSLFLATTMIGRDHTTMEALPLDRVLSILHDRAVLRGGSAT